VSLLSKKPNSFQKNFYTNAKAQLDESLYLQKEGIKINY